MKSKKSDAMLAWKLFIEGRLAQEEERFQDALSLYNNVLDLIPDHGYAGVTKGCVLARLDRMDEAIITFDTIFKNHYQNPDIVFRYRAVAAHNNKAYHLAWKGRTEEAIKIYDQLIHEFSDDPDASILYKVFTFYIAKISLLKKLDRYQEAEQVNEQAVQFIAKNSYVLESSTPPLLDKNPIAEKYTMLTRADLDKTNQWVPKLKKLLAEI